MASPDSIVPNFQNPQSLNRYSYVNNNPVRFTDPTGHCIFLPPYDTLACIGLLALALTGDVSEPAPPPNYPENNTIITKDPMTNAPVGCPGPLTNCFNPPDVYLMDFEGRDETNPIPSEEFHSFLDTMAADLTSHELGLFPGYFAGRHVYDTPFYNGGGAPDRVEDPEGVFPSSQHVCIDGLMCSGRSEVNYVAQGMWSAASGESLFVSTMIASGWKLEEYGEWISDESLYWLEYGYNYYFEWLESQESWE